MATDHDANPAGVPVTFTTDEAATLEFTLGLLGAFAGDDHTAALLRSVRAKVWSARTRVESARRANSDDTETQ